MDNRLLALAIFIALSACLHQGYGTTIVRRGAFEAFDNEVAIESSRSLIDDELQYERRGVWMHEDDDSDDDDDDDNDDDDGGSEESGDDDSDDSDDDDDDDDYSSDGSEDDDDESVSVESDSSSDESSDSSLERVKRTTFNIKNFMWPHKIPYVMDFTSVERRYRLRKVLDHLESQLCVKFYNEEERLDKSNPNWLKELGYDTDSYIFFQTGKGCWSLYGQGKKGRPRSVVPCYGYLTMLHEMLHSLGGQHAQKHPLRDKYITLHNVNIREGKRNLYSRTPIQDRITYSYFDSASNILYGNHFCSAGGPTYDFVRPEMGKLSGMRSIKTLMYEMTQTYKCSETFCSHVTKDCGPGYLTFLNDECVCVCPDHYDPKTNCATLVDRVEGPSSWPDTPFSMYKTHEPCPDGFSEGTIRLKGKDAPKQTGVPLDIEGSFLNIKVCTRTTPVSKGKWEEWPVGAYCIGKVKDTSCALPFEETTFDMKVAGVRRPLKGSVGDVRFKRRESEVIIKFCCIQQAATRIPIELPNTQPFRLLKAEGSCQEVNGMFSVETSITTKTKTKLSGYKPAHHIQFSFFTHSSCLYTPPVYGCNRIFKLTPDQTSVTFSIPTKDSRREGSRRCFFAFEAPAQTRLRLTFDKFSLHPQDKLFVKRFHPWTNHYRVPPSDSRPGQMITESNYLFVESWTHFEEDRKYTGADLTVDLLPDSDMCYTPSTQGADYAGDTSVTELYEDCVAWKDATTCPDFPWEHSMTLLTSGNKCRNLDTRDMLQPWCYSHVNDKVCVRRYCDACNETVSMDRVTDCRKMMNINKESACSDPYFKNGCFVSCGESTQPYDKNNVKCSRPDIPSEVSVQEVLQDSYAVGSSVALKCQGIDTDIECTSHGWTPFADSCTGHACLDASQSCQEILTNFPEFCTHAKSTDLASQLCKNACGVCQAGTCGVSDGATYTVVSPSGGQVATGHPTTFACHDDKTLVSGELTRACSLTGDLLAQEPQCQDQLTVSVEINRNSIREHFITDKFHSRTALLMLSQEFRIPFDGKITHWFYYCRDNEDVYLLVYRETDSPNVYEQVGKNKAKCVNGLPWTYFVPSDERVPVKKGDVIGVFQSTVSFAHTECGGGKAPVVMTKKMQPSDLSEPSTTFPKKSCLRVPLGARVKPHT